MTEIKADYSTNYWETVARQERKKAEDNLRLAAERAGEIAELQRELVEAKAEIERLTRLLELERSNE